MKRLTILTTFALVLAACGGTSGDTTVPADVTSTTAGETSTTPGSDGGSTTSGANDTTTTAAPPSGGAQFVVSGLMFGPNPTVTITNIGGESGSLDGHFLCQRPNYDGIGDVELGAGESVTLAVGDDVNIGGLSNGGGEVGLYTSTNFADADSIISYVEWGNAGHPRSGVAGEAGVWSGFVPTTASTLSLVADSLPAQSPDSWSEG